MRCFLFILFQVRDASVLELKFAKINQRALHPSYPRKHVLSAVEGRYLVGAGFKPALTSGFRGAPPRESGDHAGLPGMTPKSFNEFR
jgi:hypothetical protein